jgi:hypothetical protein
VTFQPSTITADGTPDDESVLAMKAALRNLQMSKRKVPVHPRRAEILTILTDARARIERINQPTT